MCLDKAPPFDKITYLVGQADDILSSHGQGSASERGHTKFLIITAMALPNIVMMICYITSG